MATTRIDIIDRGVKQAHVWINDVAEEFGTEDRHRAYRVVRAFLQVQRDHLSLDAAAQLVAQLPIFCARRLLRGPGPRRTPEHARDVDAFLWRIAAEAALSGETEASIASGSAPPGSSCVSIG